MTSNYLDLNKKHIRKDVISKLKSLGYEISNDAEVRQIRNVVMEIQNKNSLMIDGLIGIETMRVLGYSANEIRKILKIPRNNSSYNYPTWLLYF
jgi:Holliday junction resolvasome RuvABC DNA-binding subunit